MYLYTYQGATITQIRERRLTLKVVLEKLSCFGAKYKATESDPVLE